MKQVQQVLNLLRDAGVALKLKSATFHAQVQRRRSRDSLGTTQSVVWYYGQDMKSTSIDQCYGITTSSCSV